MGRAHVGSLQTLAALHCCQTGRAGGDISPSPRPLQISRLPTGYNEDTVNTSSRIQYHHFDRYINNFISRISRSTFNISSQDRTWKVSFYIENNALNEFNLKTLSQNIVTHVQGRIVTFYCILGYSHFY